VPAFTTSWQAFASPDTKRSCFVSNSIPDIGLGQAEVRRVVDLGAKSLQLPVFPSEFGLPE